MRRRLLMIALAGLLWLAPTAWAIDATLTKTVLVNTDAADFSVVAAVAGQSVWVTHLTAQNLGAAKVTFQLCNGACASATQILGPFELSAVGATTEGGSYRFGPCESKTGCALTITPGNAVIAQVSTGATNTVRLAVTYAVHR